MAAQMPFLVKHDNSYRQIIAEIMSVFYYIGGAKLSQRK